MIRTGIATMGRHALARASGPALIVPALVVLLLPAGAGPASGQASNGLSVRILGQELPADSLPSVEEIVLSFGPDGDPDAGREGIRALAAAGPASQATLWIQLLAVLERVDAGSAPPAVRAVGLAKEGNGLAGAELLLGAVTDAERAARPSLLHLAMLLAEADDPLAAAEIRTRLLEEHPEALEAPEASLRKARRLLESEAGHEEGLDLLEALLVGAPDHPIAPEARRLFDRASERADDPQGSPR